MPSFPKGSYRDRGDDASERSSFTDEVGYHSSSDTPRRSNNSSDTSHDDLDALPRVGHSLQDDAKAINRQHQEGPSLRSVNSQPWTDPHATHEAIRQGLREQHTYHRENVTNTSLAESSKSASFFPLDDAVDLSHLNRQARSSDGRPPSHSDSDSMNNQDRKASRSTRSAPPLSRALLIRSSGEGEASLKSYGSDDGLGTSQEGAGASPFHGSTTSSTSQAFEPSEMVEGNAIAHLPKVQAHVDGMDEGSQTGISLATDDCGCSLDVEAHSVHSMGTRSVYSHDEALLLPRVEAACIHDAPLEGRRSEWGHESFRRSPRGYMETVSERGPLEESSLRLPLKRGHDDDGAQSLAYHQQSPRGDRVRSTGWSGEDQYRRRSVRRRSRSRSLSPNEQKSGDPLDELDGDRTPPDPREP